MYQALHLQEKSDQTRKKMNELGTENKTDMSVFIQNKNEPLEFIIRMGEEQVTGFIVELNGTVKWRTFGGLSQKVAIGRIHPWNVICANPYRE